MLEKKHKTCRRSETVGRVIATKNREVWFKMKEYTDASVLNFEE